MALAPRRAAGAPVLAAGSEPTRGAVKAGSKVNCRHRSCRHRSCRHRSCRHGSCRHWYCGQSSIEQAMTLLAHGNALSRAQPLDCSDGPRRRQPKSTLKNRRPIAVGAFGPRRSGLGWPNSWCSFENAAQFQCYAGKRSRAVHAVSATGRAGAAQSARSDGDRWSGVAQCAGQPKGPSKNFSIDPR